jgi:hypothetical protein
MRKKILLALAAALPLVAAGCNSFLSGDKLSNNPNRPTVASEYELFVGSEVDVMQLWETYPMNLLPLWAEQIAGVQRQWKDFSQFRSGTDQFAADGLWNTTYGQGGINDLLRVDSGATAINNV